MKISYNGYGGYIIGKYHIIESNGKYDIKSDLDKPAEYVTETFQEAVNWCLDIQ